VLVFQFFFPFGNWVLFLRQIVGSACLALSVTWVGDGVDGSRKGN
jgi:hypothetical protein